jgi:adenosylmethionine---8-amino-7-oxononanoate aminotransferase
VSADCGFTAPFSHLRFPVHRVHSAYCAHCPVGKRRSECAIDCIQSLLATLEPNSERIAAIIVEPLLQGAGGMIVHPVEFLKQIRTLCDRYEVLLIADEVLTGFGRCGKMFACEIAGVVPDLMCISKGITGGFLPLGATLCTEAVYNEFRGEGRSFFHGHSYTGNPLACAAAVANLEIFEAGDVWKQIDVIAALHKQRLGYFSSHPDVLEVRQVGTVAVIELKAEDAGYFSTIKPRLYKFFLERGVLLRPLGHVIYVLPPYCINSEDLNLVYDVIEEAMGLVRYCTTGQSARL